MSLFWCERCNNLSAVNHGGERNIKSVQVNAPGWQLECWALAKARTEFAAEGFSEKNLPFFDELRVAYQLKTKPNGNKMIFSPLNSD